MRQTNETETTLAETLYYATRAQMRAERLAKRSKQAGSKNPQKPSSGDLQPYNSSCKL